MIKRKKKNPSHPDNRLVKIQFYKSKDKGIKDKHIFIMQIQLGFANKRFYIWDSINKKWNHNYLVQEEMNYSLYNKIPKIKLPKIMVTESLYMNPSAPKKEKLVNISFYKKSNKLRSGKVSIIYVMKVAHGYIVRYYIWSRITKKWKYESEKTRLDSNYKKILKSKMPKIMVANAVKINPVKKSKIKVKNPMTYKNIPAVVRDKFETRQYGSLSEIAIFKVYNYNTTYIIFYKEKNIFKSMKIVGGSVKITKKYTADYRKSINRFLDNYTFTHLPLIYNNLTGESMLTKQLTNPAKKTVKRKNPSQFEQKILFGYNKSKGLRPVYYITEMKSKRGNEYRAYMFWDDFKIASLVKPLLTVKKVVQKNANYNGYGKITWKKPSYIKTNPAKKTVKKKNMNIMELHYKYNQAVASGDKKKIAGYKMQIIKQMKLKNPCKRNFTSSKRKLKRPVRRKNPVTLNKNKFKDIETARCIKAHKTFNNEVGRTPDKVIETKLDLHVKDNNIVLTQLGFIEEITYVSDKFDGKKRRYTHTFKRYPVMMANPEMTVLILAPIKTNKRGIIS